ncbi:site-specific integrase [Microbulbifer pacificus]|uniref:site-specific integrase n=1 Tax=Microbulbifer pacificus TaxID=407164 RepID=UPI000CF37AC3|nr:site-specific integrase [Microbulbifer pacificus]
MDLKCIYRRGNLLYYRWQIPPDLQSIIGKRVYMRSLQTSCKYQAASRAGTLQSAVDKIKEARAMTPDRQEAGYQKLIRKLWQQLQEGSTHRPSTLEELQIEREKTRIVLDWYNQGTLSEDGRFSSDRPSVYELTDRFIRKTWPTIPMDQIRDSEHYERFIGDVVKLIHVAGETRMQTLSPEHNKPELPDFLATPEKPIQKRLSDVIQPYTAYKKGNNPKLSDTSLEAYRDSINDLIFVLGNRPVDDVSFEDAQHWRDTMRKLPANRNKRFPGKGLNDLLALKLSDDQRLSSATIHDKLQYLKGIFKWLFATKQIAHSPFELVTIQAEKVSYSEFSIPDLKKLFTSDLYTPDSKYFRRSTTKPTHWWLAPMMLFTGARPGELLQLNVSDFKIEDGVLFADLTDDDKQLKSKAAKRRVPMHQQLIELGIQDYLQELERQGIERFFPDFKLGQRASTEATKWFNERYRGSFLPDSWKQDKKTLYSFRSTHITDALNNGVNLRELQSYVGHESGQMGATKHYDRGVTLPQLKSAVDTVSFDGLCLDHLIDQWRDL